MARKIWALRYPRTTAELRANQEGWERPDRRHLPTVYDDIWRRAERCWKSQRKTKYKLPR